jgi:endonuclease/exonuclease/phosphatase family metal-dependent hydrolase
MPVRAWSGMTGGNAPRFIRFVICAAWLFTISSCGKSNSTPDWGHSSREAPAIEQTSSKAPQTKLLPESQPDSGDASERLGSQSGFRFIAYNVENWLTMDRFVDNKQLKNSPKPESEKKAVIGLLTQNKPDIVGLCEIGEAKDLAEIQESLKAAGLNLPHSHYTGGSDPTRHLGLLSRFPIVSTAEPTETDFQLNGKTFSMNRGILDATIVAHGKSYRFLGVHLKSKRVIEEADQEEMRIHEARLLRRHVDALLQKDPQARLIVYGDFNDTRSTKTLKTVTGSYNDPGYLTALPMKDSRGDAWTHYWALHDIYSRIDFITVSRALRPEVDFRASHLVDDADWNKASDHRPMVAILK